jgi:AcrR family transcriptional regulator
MGATSLSVRKRGRPRRSDKLDDQESGAERLLAVAMAAFASRGYAGTSVRTIAAAAQVDPALVIHQFGSKADLWHAAVDAVAAQLLAALGPVRLIASEGVSKAAETLAAMVGHLVDTSCDTPLIAQFVLTELAQQDARSDYVFEKLVKPVHDLLAPLIAAVEREDGADIDPDLAFIAFNGAIVTAVVSRPFIIRMSEAARSEAHFREQLKRTVIAQLLPPVRKV